ncbi:hypothetical protein CgunFtcFv8_020103 [Champsocephalus gunnari]|uniref:Uncharacterized protein n=1 Tax=Champsocephalus gunnari TaxID=52237 RepID=A0AAN8DMR0_CHAGU|nr:hypothetical protein CgunFtcFv8_020103 [Champsocephalus gunnari]
MYKVNRPVQNLPALRREEEICTVRKTTCQKVSLGRGQSDVKYIPAVSRRGGGGCGGEDNRRHSLKKGRAFSEISQFSPVSFQSSACPL